MLAAALPNATLPKSIGPFGCFHYKTKGKPIRALHHYHFLENPPLYLSVTYKYSILSFNNDIQMMTRIRWENIGCNEGGSIDLMKWDLQNKTTLPPYYHPPVSTHHTEKSSVSCNEVLHHCHNPCTAIVHRHPTLCAWTFSRSVIECTATDHMNFSHCIYTSFHGNLFPLAWIWVVIPHSLTWASLDTGDWGDSL